ncbi:MAG: HD-GYP domain-containing protein [Anaerosomatales bacterium]|nr:HD-GYP domain-containing protein [Anaerosomatales bacterium]
MSDYPRAFKTFVWSVVACAAIAVYYTPRPPLSHGDFASLLALAALAQVSEALAVSLPVAGSVSLSYAAVYASVVLYGGLPAVIVALCGSITVQEIRQHKSIWAVVFNAAQMAASAALSCLVLDVVGVPPLTSSWSIHAVSGKLLAGWMLAALVLWFVNALMFSVAVSITRGLPLRHTLHAQKLASFLINLGFLAPLGFLMAVVLLRRGWPTLLVLAIPFVLERQVLRAYVRLAESYTDNVRLLVSAIESKDPYTRGHSERVAFMARKLATRMKLSPRQVDLVERAALLHDLGKIGVPISVLRSSAELDPEEAQQIRLHPTTGADLVSRIALVSEASEAVLSHHERPDGAGYPRGLRDSDIPLIARVLACADVFDAMTSDRPYRSALGTDVALQEIVRVAGTQLDARIAMEFVRMLQDEQTMQNVHEQ